MDVPTDLPLIPACSRRFHIASISTGAYEFIPVPFLDEWLIARKRRSMVADILEKRGITCDTNALDILTGSGKGLLVRLGSMTRGLILKPIRKLFRSLLFWLTARSAARTAMVTYFLARFLHHPDLLPPGAGAKLTEQRAHYLADVFKDISKNIDLRAARNTFGQLVRLFAKQKKASGNEVSRTIEQSAPGFLAEFDFMVQQKLSG